VVHGNPAQRLSDKTDYQRSLDERTRLQKGPADRR
jgi:hypothetical protein